MVEPAKKRTRRTKAQMAEARGEAAPGPGPQVDPPGADGAIGADALVQAIRWCDMAQSHDDGARPAYETHSLVNQGWLLAYDGVISAGHTSPLSGFFAPHTGRLLAALTKAGKGLSVVMAEDKLMVRSAGFRCSVPFLPGTNVDVPYPQNAQYAASDAIGAAIEAVLPLVKASGDTVLETSIMLTNYGTALATNRRVMIEAYHGVQMPESVIIPRRMATLMKGKTGLYGYGCDGRALTLWYGPEAYLRCQLHETNTWPPLEQFGPILSDPVGRTGVWNAVPSDLGEAIAAVEPHCASDAIFLCKDGVMSHRTPEESEASYVVEGAMPAELIAFGSESLTFMCKHAAEVAWFEEKALFRGTAKGGETGIPIRGAITTYSFDPA